MEEEEDFAQTRITANRLKLGLKEKKDDGREKFRAASFAVDIFDDPAMEQQIFTDFVRENIKMKECINFVVKEGRASDFAGGQNACFCGERRILHWRTLRECDDLSRTSTAGLQYDSEGDPLLIPAAANDSDAPTIMYRSCLPSRRKKSVFEEPCVKVNKERQLNTESSIELWNEVDSFLELPTNAFGKIEFANDESPKPAPFIRISDTTPVSTVLNILRNHWRLGYPHRPSLVISVIGGAKHFRFEGQKAKEVFNNGLINAANATNAWILTSGEYMGVCKAVGEAVRQGQAAGKATHNLKCIALSLWGYVLNREDLVSSDGMGSWPAIYSADPVLRRGKPTSLDPNHTHFILFDNGYRNFFRSNLAEYRAEFENCISDGDENEPGTPVVVVLLEGGFDSLNMVTKSIGQAIPVVVCEGTGRIADVLAFAFKSTIIEIDENGEQKRTFSEETKFDLVQKLRAIYSKNYHLTERSELFLQEKLEQIHTCCEKEHLITVFDVNKSDEFDLAILSAILKGRDSHPIDQLRLALKWNCCDVARRELCNEQIDWNWPDLDDLMTEALLDGKADFVELFLEQGVVLKDHLTGYRLRMLYNGASPNCALERLLHCGFVFLCDVKEFFHNFSHHIHLSSIYSIDEEDAEQMRKSSIAGASTCEKKLLEAHMHNPFKDLFLWAILSNRPSMADLFWQRGQNPLIRALIGRSIYRLLRRKVGEHTTLALTYRQQQDHFEQLSVGVISEAYHIDSVKALILIERSHSPKTHISCLTTAAQSYAKPFLATDCCQESVQDTWKRGMRCAGHDVLFGILCPLYITIRICFEEKLIKGRLGALDKLKIFYWAPITKFCAHLLAHIAYLFLYTFVLLFDIHIRRFTWLEMLLHFWTFSMALCEVEQFVYFTMAQGHMCRSYLKHIFGMNFWFQMVYLGIGFHLVGFILRAAGALTIEWMRLVFSLAVAIFYMRLFRFYMASTYLGPKLFVIRKMFKDVFMFFAIVFVIMLAYSVAIQSLLYPVRSFYWGIFSELLYYPYWQLYGELALDETIQGVVEGCDGRRLSNDHGQFCPKRFWPVTLIMAGYLLVGNILLVNLLIAIFTHVFDSVQKNSVVIWKYEMYSLATEFDSRPVLPPPFNLPETIFRFVKWCINRKKAPTAEISLSEKQLENLKIFEKAAMDSYLKSLQDSEPEIDAKIEQLHKEVEALRENLSGESKITPYSRQQSSGDY